MENYIYCTICKKSLIYHGRDNPGKFGLCDHTKNGEYKSILVIEHADRMSFYKKGGRRWKESL